MELLFAYNERGQGKKNEDIFGVSGSFAWVIDGATDVFQKKLLFQNNEVSKYVSILSRTLKRQASNYAPEQLKELLLSSVSSVSSYLDSKKTIDPSEEFMLPTFAIAMVAVSRYALYYLILGDCFISFINNKKVEVLTDRRITAFSIHNREMLKKMHRESKDFSDAISIYRETRKKANADGGYPIGSFWGSGIKDAITGKIDLDPGNSFIICSDGIMDYFNYADTEQYDFFDPQRIQKAIAKMNDYLNDDSIYYSDYRPKKLDDRTILLMEV